MDVGRIVVEWVTDAERFASLADQWDALLPADSTPFDAHSWYAIWWEAFGAPYELSVCTLRRDGELAAVFPLARDGHRLTPMANEHASLFRPLARDREAIEALIATVVDEAGLALEIGRLPAGDPCIDSLLSGARSGGMAVLAEHEFASPIVATAGDFETWRKQAKSRWGAPLERFSRKMGRDYEAEFSIIERPADLEAELVDGFRVEASGWKGRAGTAIVSSPETEAFYSSLARAFDRCDELRLSRIALDGRLVAFDLCLLHRNRLYLLKTGFDEDFRRLAPGLVMRLLTVRRCFELGLDAHELLGVESDWKMKFATGTRDHVIFRGYRRRSPALAKYLYRAAVRPALKGAYRRLRPADGCSSQGSLRPGKREPPS
jgi:CelD/BcsL family acetyltransferase involved in cellulose biosynthesis